MIGFFRVLISYLRRHMTLMIAFAAAFAIFAAVFSLYDLPPEAVLYAFVLTAAALILLGTIRFSAFYRKHRILTALIKRIEFELPELPAPGSVVEADYQKLIRRLNASYSAAISEADRARSDMTDYYTLWAHQIKTPIAAMRLLLQSEESRRNAELSAELFKIEQYVEMVLGYLRLDSETTDYVIRKVDLDIIVRQSLRKYARLFILKKLSLDFRETGLVVLTDEKWLCFVIEQVLSNALKYTNAGKITIYAEGTDLLISDTGIGIRPEDLPRVFERGFTGYNGREDKKSTGIGLYLCRRIMDQLGHTITIDSEVGSGTAVRLGLSSAELHVE
ncbi:MAG: HAMP domain-containing histidine kinase [Clostridia bacterium]|nr:HAMP domain-containing histidine kinase [Clostridia bacterium]